MSWLSASLSKTTPSSTSIALTVLDGNTSLPFAGFSGLNTTQLDLTSINPRWVPTIALEASFEGNGTATPSLDSWSVTFGTSAPGPSSHSPAGSPWVIGAMLGGFAAALALGVYLALRAGPRPPLR